MGGRLKGAPNQPMKLTVAFGPLGLFSWVRVFGGAIRVEAEPPWRCEVTKLAAVKGIARGGTSPPRRSCETVLRSSREAVFRASTRSGRFPQDRRLLGLRRFDAGVAVDPPPVATELASCLRERLHRRSTSHGSAWSSAPP